MVEYLRKLQYAEYCSPQEMMSHLIASAANTEARIDELRRFMESNPDLADRFSKRYGYLLDTKSKLDKAMNQVLYSKKFNKIDENGNSQMRCVTKDMEAIK
jgi:hypothetical protein